MKSNNQMNKLDEIPKKNPFIVPEGYFENLPSVIQSRTNQKDRTAYQLIFSKYRLAYVLPVFVICTFGILWFSQLPKKSDSTESLLATIPTDYLIAYVEDMPFSNEELLQELTNEDLESLETELLSIPFQNDEITIFYDEIHNDSL